MRIALMQPYMDHFGGAERHLHNLALELRRREHDVLVLTRRYDEALFFNGHGPFYVVHEVAPAAWSRIFRSKRIERRALATELRRIVRDCDVVVPFDSIAWRWIAWALRGSGPPVVWFCEEPQRRLHWRATERSFLEYVERAKDGLPLHLARLKQDIEGTEGRTPKRRKKSERERAFDRKCLSWTNAVIANSTYTAESVRLALGCDPDVCYPCQALPNQMKARTREGVLIVSPLRPKKNVETVIAALAHVRYAYGRSDIRLTVAGEGQQRADLEYLVRSFGLQESVRFTGFVPDEELPQYYADHRAVVYVPFDEPFGFVAVEAIAQGTPVVGSNHGGLTEIIEDGVSGRLVDPFEPETVARGILDLYDQNETVPQDVVKRTRDIFGLERLTTRFEALLEKVLNRRISAPHPK